MSLSDRAGVGAWIGALAGIGVFVLEAIASLPLVPAPDRLMLSLHLAAWLPTAGALAGAVAGVLARPIAALAAKIAKVRSPSPDVARGRAIAVFLLPAFGYVAWQLFSGGAMRRIPARWGLIPAVAIVLALGFSLVCAVAARLLRRFPEMKRGRAIAIGIALFVLAAMLHRLDLRLYARLYGYLHACLAASTAGTLALLVALVRTRVRLPRRRWVGPLAATISIALVVLSSRSLGARQSVRYVAFERTAGVKYVLRAADRLLHSSRQGALTRAERRAIYEREQRARRAGDSMPQLPGANVLLVTVDALRADHTGFVGGTRLTPNLDRLAARGAVFERAYCQAPHSSYSLTSLHTSEYQHEVVELSGHTPIPTLAETLNAAGYFTGAFYTRGVFHTEGERLTHYDDIRFGFSVADHGNRRAEEITDRGIEEIDRIVARGEPKFFLWMHYFDTHEPYRDTSLGTSPHDRYRGEVRHADREIARLLAHVRRVVARDTIVVLTADHGEEFQEHGGSYHGSSLYDEQVRVPLLFSVPGAPQRQLVQTVQSIDVAPTLLGLLGLAVPQTMRGTDLRSLLYGGDAARPALPAFSTVIQKKMVVSWPYKLIADFQYDVYELYDLEHDPHETRNLYDEKREIADRLKDEIHAWMDRVREVARRSPADNALALGRLGDRRAGPELVKLVRSRSEEIAVRAEAARLLGHLQYRPAHDVLVPLVRNGSRELAVASAAALAAMDDDRGREVLFDGLYSEDFAMRTEAALGLAALGDRRAVDALKEALHAEDLRIRKEAIQALGLLRDTRAIGALLEILPDTRVRYLVVLSLGMIGDPRAYETLMDLLDREASVDIRGYAVAALGWIRNPAAIDRVIRVFHEEPEHKWTSETLVRLGAVDRGRVLGSDAKAGAPGLGGLGRCREQPFFSFETSEFLNQTWCETAGRRATLRFEVPSATAATLAIRMRHLGDPGKTAQVDVSLDGRPFDGVEVTDAWHEARFPISADRLGAGSHEIVVEIAATRDVPPKLGLDHLLVVPR